MGIRKRFAAGLICAALALSLASPALAIDSSAKLNTKEHVGYARTDADGYFRPTEGLTRGEMAIMLERLLVSLPESAASFTDVSPEDACYSAVGALGGWGIVDGYEDGGFHPKSPIKRAEFVAILARFYPLGEGLCTFTDVSSEHWGYDEIALAQSRSWVDGYDDGTFRPDNGILRGEAVCLINKVLGRAADREALSEAGVFCYWDVAADYWAYYDIMEATVPHEHTSSDGGEQWTGVKDPGLSLPAGTYYIKGELYSVDANGLLLRDTAVGDLYFGADGRYTSGNAELDGAVKSILASVAKEGMTQRELLSAAYCFVRDMCTYRKGPILDYGVSGWEEENGLSMLTGRKGNCYGFAAAFYYLARQLGYDAAAVSGELRNSYTRYTAHHGWVVITENGTEYICDPELEWSMRNVHATLEDFFMRAPGDTGNWEYYYYTADGEMKFETSSNLI